MCSVPYLNYHIVRAIAYHQPITRNGLKDIFGKGINRDLMAGLLYKDLIASGRRAPRLGAPHKFVTTDSFPTTFDLQSLRDLQELDLPIYDANKEARILRVCAFSWPEVLQLDDNPSIAILQLS